MPARYRYPTPNTNKFFFASLGVVTEELGQCVRRSEVTEMNRWFERMSREELHDYARTGALPDWFPAKPRQEVTEEPDLQALIQVAKIGKRS
jgi:hypothetical protein